MLCIFLTTLTVEISQVIIDLVTGYRVKIFDVDDIITNFVGGVIGLYVGLFFIKQLSKVIVIYDDKETRTDN